MNTVAQPVTAVISTVLGLGGSSGINNAAYGSRLHHRTFCVAHQLQQQRQRLEMVQSDGCGPAQQTALSSTQSGAAWISVTMKALRCSSLPLKSWLVSGLPSMSAPDSAYLLLLSGATTIFFHSGVEAWAAGVFGCPAPPQSGGEAGPSPVWTMRATSESGWSINSSGAAGASQGRAPPQQLLQHDVSVYRERTIFVQVA